MRIKWDSISALLIEGILSLIVVFKKVFMEIPLVSLETAIQADLIRLEMCLERKITNLLKLPGIVCSAGNLKGHFFKKVK